MKRLLMKIRILTPIKFGLNVETMKDIQIVYDWGEFEKLLKKI